MINTGKLMSIIHWRCTIKLCHYFWHKPHNFVLDSTTKCNIYYTVLKYGFNNSTFNHIYYLLMYKIAVYRLVNGVITHQKQPISKKVILRSMTLP